MPGITPVAFPSLLHLTLTQSDEVDVFDLVLLMSQLAKPKSHNWNVEKPGGKTPFI